MTIDEFDARAAVLACPRCGLGPLTRYQVGGGALDGREVVVCSACGAVLEWLDREALLA